MHQVLLSFHLVCNSYTQNLQKTNISLMLLSVSFSSAVSLMPLLLFTPPPPPASSSSYTQIFMSLDEQTFIIVITHRQSQVYVRGKAHKMQHHDLPKKMCLRNHNKLPLCAKRKALACARKLDPPSAPAFWISFVNISYLILHDIYFSGAKRPLLTLSVRIP